jgi:uncharacterized phage-associated protein
MSIIEKKILNSIIYFASKSQGNKINRLKLMKLLWLADRIHLNKYGRLILKDNYNALPHGPVPSRTMDVSKQSIINSFDVNGFTISAKGSFDSKYFSKSDIEVLEQVWAKYGNMNQFELRDFSHKFPEWLRYEKELNDKCLPNSYPIIIDDFFSSPEKNVDYQFDADESSVSISSYRSYNSILSSLSE